MNSNEAALYANCTLCGVSICWGDHVVTIARYEERIQANGKIHVTGEDTLVSLCATCGSKFSAAAVRLDLRGRLFCGLAGRGF